MPKKRRFLGYSYSVKGEQGVQEADGGVIARAKRCLVVGDCGQ